MTHSSDQEHRGRRSGGEWAEPKPAGGEGERDSKRRVTEAAPREDRLSREREPGVAPVVGTIIVQDESGQIVSVTKVSPEAKFGVGVKLEPGQTMTERPAGTLAEDPFQR